MKRSVRKLLAVALAVAMAFSLVTVASAATPKKYQDYTDASSINQKEAVDVLTGIGVLNGIDGAFKPADNVTREQAAKIICYLLIGATAADSLRTSTSSFTDVDPSRWSAGCIQYCASKGIINGLGDGTFNPEGNVTGSQFAKMLLTALGYGKLGEYVGPNWEINAIADAQRLGILTLDVDCSAPATREQIAQYAFNAYTKVDVVAFSKDTENYVTANATKPTLAKQRGLEQSAPQTVNGVDMYFWKLNGVALNSNWYTSAAQVVLATSNDGTPLSLLTTPGNTKYKASLDTTAPGVTYYRNGAPLTVTEYATGTNYNAGDYITYLGNLYRVTSAYTYTLGDDFYDVPTYAMHSRGINVSFVDTDSDGKAEKVLFVEKSVVVLAAAPVVSSTGYVSVAGICTNQAPEFVEGYAGLAAGDVVLWYKDAANVYHLQKAAAVAGQMTALSDFVMTFAGQWYSPSGLVTSSVSQYDAIYGAKFLSSLKTDSTKYNTDATIYLDDSGAVVYMKVGASTVSANYALLVDYQYYYTSAVAKIVKGDGTVGVYSVAADATGMVPDQRSDFDFSAAPYGYLVSYNIGSDGKITLTPVGTSGSVSATTPYGAGSSVITLAGTPDFNLYLTSSTKFFYFNVDAAYGTGSPANLASVATGYANTVGTPVSTAVTYVLAPGTTNVVAAILIDQTASITSGANYCYVMYGGSPSVRYVGSTPYYDYSVYEDGTFKVLTSKIGTLFAAPGLYEYYVDSSGYVVNTPAAPVVVGAINPGPTPGYDTKYVDPNYFVLSNDNVYQVDSNTKYFLVDATFPGSVTAGSLGVSNAYVHYTVTYAYNTDTDPAYDVVYYTYSVS